MQSVCVCVRERERERERESERERARERERKKRESHGAASIKYRQAAVTVSRSSYTSAILEQNKNRALHA
jgi:hypothetical protein